MAILIWSWWIILISCTISSRTAASSWWQRIPSPRYPSLRLIGGFNVQIIVCLDPQNISWWSASDPPEYIFWAHRFFSTSRMALARLPAWTSSLLIGTAMVWWIWSHPKTPSCTTSSRAYALLTKRAMHLPAAARRQVDVNLGLVVEWLSGSFLPSFSGWVCFQVQHPVYQVVEALIFNRERSVISICSPPVRWGLLDFMLAVPPPPSSPSPSPDLKCKRYIAVFPARSEDQSDPRRTSTASARSQCSPPDQNSKHRTRAFPAGPPPQALGQSGPRRTSTTKIFRRYTR